MPKGPSNARKNSKSYKTIDEVFFQFFAGSRQRVRRGAPTMSGAVSGNSPAAKRTPKPERVGHKAPGSLVVLGLMAVLLVSMLAWTLRGTHGYSGILGGVLTREDTSAPSTDGATDDDPREQLIGTWANTATAEDGTPGTGSISLYSDGTATWESGSGSSQFDWQLTSYHDAPALDFSMSFSGGGTYTYQCDGNNLVLKQVLSRENDVSSLNITYSFARQ